MHIVLSRSYVLDLLL